MAVLQLRSSVEAACAQQVIDAIVTDDAVLSGLGAAHVLRNAAYTGAPPQEMLQQLKQGPGKHMKENAYRYRRTLDGELASIRRIYELKDRTFQALWAVFAAGMIGVFGFISRMLWGFYGDDIVASVIG